MLRAKPSTDPVEICLHRMVSASWRFNSAEAEQFVESIKDLGNTWACAKVAAAVRSRDSRRQRAAYQEASNGFFNDLSEIQKPITSSIHTINDCSAIIGAPSEPLKTDVVTDLFSSLKTRIRDINPEPRWFSEVANRVKDNARPALATLGDISTQAFTLREEVARHLLSRRERNIRITRLQNRINDLGKDPAKAESPGFGRLKTKLSMLLAANELLQPADEEFEAQRKLLATSLAEKGKLELSKIQALCGTLLSTISATAPGNEKAASEGRAPDRNSNLDLEVQYRAGLVMKLLEVSLSDSPNRLTFERLTQDNTRSELGDLSATDSILQAQARTLALAKALLSALFPSWTTAQSVTLVQQLLEDRRADANQSFHHSIIFQCLDAIYSEYTSALRVLYGGTLPRIPS